MGPIVVNRVIMNVPMMDRRTGYLARPRMRRTSELRLTHFVRDFFSLFCLYCIISNECNVNRIYFLLFLFRNFVLSFINIIKKVLFY